MTFMHSEMYLPLARKMLATEPVSWTDTARVSMFYVGAGIKLQAIAVARFATGFIFSLCWVPVAAVKLYERIPGDSRSNAMGPENG